MRNSLSAIILFAIVAGYYSHGTADVLVFDGFSGMTDEVVGEVTVNYTFNAESGTQYVISDVAYRIGTDGVWNPVGSADLAGIEYQANGSYSFVWNTLGAFPGRKEADVCLSFAAGGYNEPGTWTSLSPMAQKRYDFEIAELNGVIYAAGGGANSSSPLASVEAYDPVSGSWTTVSSMPIARKAPGLGAAAGKLYAVGGWNGSYLSSMDAYDPAADAWTTAAIPTMRNECAVVTVDDKLYVFASWYGPTRTFDPAVEAYDPATGVWSTLSPMPSDRIDFSAEVIDGKVYVVGGWRDPDFTMVTAVDVYDVATDTWSTLDEPMPVTRFNAASCVLNGKMYLVGGKDRVVAGIEHQGTLLEFSPESGEWAVRENIPVPRSDCGGVAYDGTFYVAGGFSGSNSSSTVTLFDAYVPGMYGTDGNSVVTPSFTVDNLDEPAVLAFTGAPAAGDEVSGTVDVGYAFSDDENDSNALYGVMYREGSDGVWTAVGDGALSGTGYRLPGTYSFGFDTDVLFPEMLAEDVRLRFAVASAPAGAVVGGAAASWEFDEGEGDIAYDGTDGGNDGTVYGAVWTSGIRDGALSFNGTSSDYVQVAGIPSITYGHPFTVSCWVHPVAFKDYNAILGRNNTNRILISSSGKILVQNSVSGTAGNFWSANDGDVPLGEWTHIAYRSDGSEERLYVNGAFSSSKTITANGWNSDFRIGRYNDAHYQFNGMIDDVAFYDTALSDDDIQTLYDVEAGPLVSNYVTTAPFRVDNLNETGVLTLDGIPGSEGVLGGVVDVNYSLADDEGDAYRVYDVSYRIGETGGWTALDQASLGGIDYVAPGSHTFTWNTGGQFPASSADDVYLSFAAGYGEGSGTWKAKAPMPQTRYDFEAAELNGLIYAVGGGASSSGPLSSVDAYDPATDTWTPVTPTNVARKGLGLGQLGGKLYAVGGWDGSYHSTMEVYDPATGVWTVKNLPGMKVECGVAPVNGRLYVMGGWDKTAGNVIEDEVLAYDPATDSWTAMAAIPNPRIDFTLSVVGDEVYMIGGWTYPDVMETAVDVYSVTTDTWRTLADPLPQSRIMASECVRNGKVYLVGGCYAIDNLHQADLVEFDPVAGTWTTLESMLTARSDGSAALVNGKLYMAGGYVGSTSNTVTTAFEEYSFGGPADVTNYVVGGPLSIDNRHTVTASAGANGSISPAGGVKVTGGADVTFAIAADDGYRIDDVLVDGVSVGAVTSYTFENVEGPHSIAVSFVLETYVITSSSDSNGTISPAGDTEVTYGDDLAFSMSAPLGYVIDDVLVDGASVGAVSAYTFSGIEGPHSIELRTRMVYNPDVTVFTLLALGQVTLKANTELVSGSIGVIDAGGEVVVKNGASVNEGRPTGAACIKADAVDVHNNAAVNCDVFCNTLSGDVAGETVTPLALPLFSVAELPAFVPAVPGGDDITVKSNNSGMTLAAGTYGALTVKNGCVLALEAGDYHFSSIDVKNGAGLTFAGHTRIMVAGNAEFHNESAVNAGLGAAASDIIFYVGGSDVSINCASFNANVYAEDGAIEIKPDHSDGLTAVGGFIANTITVGNRVSVADGNYFAVETRLPRVAADGAVAQRISINVAPNPGFGPMNIEYQVVGTVPDGNADGTVTIYRNDGTPVRTLGSAASGSVVRWDGCDRSGNRVDAGIYLVKITVGSMVSTKSVMIAR